jgi:hypothetical protein
MSFSILSPNFPFSLKQPLEQKDGGTGVAVLEFFVNILIALAMYSLVLYIYYFSIGAPFERLSVTKNVKRVVREVQSYMDVFLSTEQKTKIQESLPTDTDSDKGADAKIDQNNKNILRKASVWTAILVISLCGFSALLYYMMWYICRKKGVQCRSFLDIIAKVGMLSAFVFITEVFFMFLIGVHWNSVSVEMIYTVLLNKALELRPNLNTTSGRGSA